MIVCIYFVGKASTNLINWFFFVLNVVCFAIIVKSDGKPATLKHAMNVAKVLKNYSVFILVFEIIFICFIGAEADTSRSDSLDQKFRRAFPNLYENLDFVGLRLYFEPGKQIPDEGKKKLLWWKFVSYICFLLVALYIEQMFAN